MIATGSRQTRRLWMMGANLLAAALFIGCSDDNGSGSSTQTGAPSKSSAESPATDSNETAKDVNSPTDESATAGNPSNTDAENATPNEPAEPVQAGATGTFSGTVILDGAAPELADLVKAGDADVKDKEVCGVNGVPDESLVVGEGNGLANVFVYLRRAPKGYTSEVPDEPVVLDQEGCVFLPHAALIQTGQQVLVKSNDAVLHNVHTFPARNQSTNVPVNAKDREGVELVYTRAESDPLQVKCDIHTWMSSYHLVLDHPFMAVTDANGKFSISDLPAGDYEFRIWHETGKLLDKGFQASVRGDDDAPVEIKYSADRFSQK